MYGSFNPMMVYGLVGLFVATAALIIGISMSHERHPPLA